MKNNSHRVVAALIILLMGFSFTEGLVAAFRASEDAGILHCLYLFLISGNIPPILILPLGAIVLVSWWFQRLAPASVAETRKHFRESHPNEVIRWVRIRHINESGPVVAVLHGYMPPIYEYYQFHPQTNEVTELGTSVSLPREFS